jgi:hypothetical protein
VATDLESSDGIPVFDRLNAGHLAERDAGTDLPPLIAFNGKNDFVVGWAEKIGFYQSMTAAASGQELYWDERDHLGGRRQWDPEQDPQMVYRYRLDRSYPSFGPSSADGDPGDGHATSGDAFGTIGGHLTWEQDPLDTPDRWEVVLGLRDLESDEGTVPAPGATVVDVVPRRLQAMQIRPGDALRAVAVDATSRDTLSTATIPADRHGVVRIPDVPVRRGGTVLSLQLVVDAVEELPPGPGPVPVEPLAIVARNPFYHPAEVTLDLPVAGVCRLDAYDATGRRLATLAHRRFAAGRRRVYWAGDDGIGGTGVVFLRLTTPAGSVVRKLIVIESR